jgi:hypothetical protein
MVARGVAPIDRDTGHAQAAELQSQAQADRAGSDDDDFLVDCGHLSDSDPGGAVGQ